MTFLSPDVFFVLHLLPAQENYRLVFFFEGVNGNYIIYLKSLHIYIYYCSVIHKKTLFADYGFYVSFLVSGGVFCKEPCNHAM